MKRIVFGLLVVAAFGFAADLKMKEVEALMDDKRGDVVVIDKKELNKYLKDKKPEPIVTEIITVDMGEAVSFDAQSGKSNSARLVYDGEVTDSGSSGHSSGDEIRSRSVVVNNLESFEAALRLNNLKQTEISYNLSLLGALDITKYLFENKMQDRYPKIKEILLSEAKKFKAIDYEAFSAACENMSEAVATDMLAELGGLR